MPRNTLGDLNNHLFEQLERLNDMDLKGAQLEEEIERSKSITKIADTIISNANLVLRAQISINEQLGGNEVPKILEG